ncbi:tetratricopeptide repeat protein [Nocardia sp. BMG111209]|uniref:ATP-binding protein n=1 Tax=Nocardia sp. BMG111209 TaxID=1160137 RepID=UPI000363902D|nr:tetratricopeptide repeat protein [Nocardia sp. BMG111209]
MSEKSNRETTRADLQAVHTTAEFGATLKRTRVAAALSIRALELRAAARKDSGAATYVNLTKNIIESMEKGHRLEGGRAAPDIDNRLEIYLWCCGVPREDLPAWLETRRRILREPRPPAPGTPAPEVGHALRTALRRDVYTLIGRDSELAQILDAAESGIPVYTIDGMPGVGKTALAIRAAHLLADRFPDGRYFVELHAHTPGRTVADPADVLAGLLTGIGVDTRYLPDSLQARRDLWQDRLAGKRVLLVLDDARDEAQIDWLLPASPGCLTLVTSRRRLVDLGNTVPLALDTLAPGSAVELFATLSHRRIGDTSDRTAVERLVQQCGHLPLAITLLAAPLAHHPAWTIADLSAEFGATADRLGEPDARTRAVRVAFDLSYQDLPPERARLFRRLGLHHGPDLDAYAAAALAGIDVAAARSELDALYTDHLLDEPARGRYRLHDLLREYARALAQTEPEPERADAETRLLDYYHRTTAAADRWIARRTRPDSTSGDRVGDPVVAREFGDEVQALEWMRMERDNLLACVEHVASRRPARMVVLIGLLAGLLDRDGPWPLACQLHGQAAAVAHDLDDEIEEAGALNNLGAAHWRAGDFPTATACFQAALTRYRSRGNVLGEANALNNLGDAREETGDYPAAVAHYQRALALYRRCGDVLGEASTLNNLGTLHEETGDYPAAVGCYEQALALYHDLDFRLGEANTLNNLGIVNARTGFSEEAVALHQQALTLYRQLGNRLGEANALTNLGIVRTRTGHYREAVDRHHQALALYHELGSLRGEASTLNNLGIVRTRTGLYDEAVDLHDTALTLSRRLGYRLVEADALHNLGVVRTGTGRYDEAVELHQQALTLYHRLGNRLGQIEVLIDLGRLLFETATAAAASTTFLDALALARQVGSWIGEAQALEGIARCRVVTGVAAVPRELGQAVEIYHRIGTPDAVAAATELLRLRSDIQCAATGSDDTGAAAC